MKEYKKYIKDILEGKIASSLYIKQQIQRMEDLKNRDDIYFDEDAVQNCFEFIKLMRHFAGKSAGKQFQLLPWQKACIGGVIGIKYKETGYRVCRELFIVVSRKNGKSSLIAALSLYMLICDGVASPSIGIVASSREQARILFEMVQKYAKSIDAKGDMIKNFRNYIKFPANDGEVKVFSSDADSLEGYRFTLGIADETHLYKDNKLIASMRASQGFETEPLLVQITTAGFLKEGYPCYETYKTSIEILAGIKQQDEFFPFLYVMDPEDDWTDEKNWVKCNPCLNETVTSQYLKQQVQVAKNDATQETSIKTKNFNMWCDAMEVWIPQEKIVKCMEVIDLEKYRGCTAYIGVDLSAVEDLTAMSVMIPDASGKMVFKTWHWLPKETFERSPNKELYRKFIQEGSLTLTNGNVVDYDAVINKMNELNKILNIVSVGYDKWNSTQWAITCTNLGFPLEEFSQAIGNYNSCTKEMAKRVLSQECIIDKSSCVVWEFGNVVLKVDANGNQKPSKENASSGKKIDGVIAMTTALGICLKNNIDDDYDIFVI